MDSCLHQDLDEDEYEIIAVNDGSYDGSLKLLKEYANRYRNIVLIDKPNGGLSSARNAGLERARGNFIWFVDSDDWIAENCLKTVCRLFDNNNIDMITFNTYYATNIGYKEQAVKWDEPMFDLMKPVPLKKCRAFLLCSDGFWELIEEKDMCALLKTSATVEDWLSSMVQVVKESGKDRNMDNFSAIAVWCDK